VTFVAFVLFGIVPLLPYLFGLSFAMSDALQLELSIVMTFVTLASLGAVKGYLQSTGIFKSAAITAVLGTLAAATGYLLGWALEGIAPSGAKA